MDIHNPVIVISTLLIVVFVVGSLIFPETARQSFKASEAWTIQHFDWLFMLAANIIVVFYLALLVLPVGRLRIDGDDAEPEFTLLYGGGKDALGVLRAAAITVGLPFVVVLLVMCVSLYMGLHLEHRESRILKPESL